MRRRWTWWMSATRTTTMAVRFAIATTAAAEFDGEVEGLEAAMKK